MRKRNGSFVIVVNDKNEWLEFVDLENHNNKTETINKILEEAKETAQNTKSTIFVYLATTEYEIKP